MRRFLILGHKAAIEPDFTLNDLPGAAGRIDVLCRAIGATLFLSHGIRRDVETNLLLQDSVHVRISGESVKRLNPDERSTAALIKHALKALADPTRMKILRYLAAEPHTPAQLSRRLRLRAPTVIHHLNALRLAGLVHLTVEPGGERRYAMRTEMVKATCDNLQDFLQKPLKE